MANRVYICRKRQADLISGIRATKLVRLPGAEFLRNPYHLAMPVPWQRTCIAGEKYSDR